MSRFDAVIETMTVVMMSVLVVPTSNKLFSFLILGSQRSQGERTRQNFPSVALGRSKMAFGCIEDIHLQLATSICLRSSPKQEGRVSVW